MTLLERNETPDVYAEHRDGEEGTTTSRTLLFLPTPVSTAHTDSALASPLCSLSFKAPGEELQTEFFNSVLVLFF